MVEGTDVHLVTTHPIAFDPLILVRMVQPLDCRVALVTFKAARAVFPPLAVLEGLAVLRRILEQVWWTAEIARVMRIYATLGIMAILFCWTPTCFVVEHKENIPLFFVIKINEVFFEETECQQTIWNEIIFDTFILEVFVDSLYVC